MVSTDNFVFDDVASEKTQHCVLFMLLCYCSFST